MGDKGCRLYDQEKNNIREFVTEKSEVYDVSGAGDVFIANLVCSLKEKKILILQLSLQLIKLHNQLKCLVLALLLKNLKKTLIKF